MSGTINAGATGATGPAVADSATGASIGATGSPGTPAIALANPGPHPYVVTLDQVGNNVVATSNAGGEFNLNGLTLLSSTNFTAGVRPFAGTLGLSNGAADAYSGASGPTSIGAGSSIVNASSSSGPPVAIVGDGEAFAGIPGSGLGVPVGYTSGTPLDSSQAIFDNTTLASLGITPGDHTWTWGTAPDQSFTIDAEAASSVPQTSGNPATSLPAMAASQTSVSPPILSAGTSAPQTSTNASTPSAGMAAPQQASVNPSTVSAGTPPP